MSFLFLSVSIHICVNTVIWERVCVFKMMDRVMLLVNNSPRCRLRSLCPSCLNQSEAFTQCSDWRKHGKDPAWYVNEKILLHLSLFLFLVSIPLSCFSRRGSQNKSFKNSKFSLTVSVFLLFAVFHPLLLPVFPSLFVSVSFLRSVS